MSRRDTRVPMVVKLPSDQDASGRSLGQEEIDLLTRVVRSGTLTSTKGSLVKELESRFAAMLGVRYAYACTSGTAAVHAAVAAIDPEPGEEIVTSPITDMGAITPILYQGAVPVFADVDSRTLNVTATSIGNALSDRTRAIIVTHLFGNPCDMEQILGLAEQRGIPVIEDSAQAFLARVGDRFVGTLGAVGCFSLQQGKHITAGEGGLVVTNDEKLARRIFLFINKAWGYGDPSPDHYFLALNARISELQGAVALAQLGKLKSGVAHRRAMAERLTRQLSDIEGVETPVIHPAHEHTYWRYCLRIDGSKIPGGVQDLSAALRKMEIPSAPRYIQKPAFQCEIFQKQRTFGKSRYPFNLARPAALDYSDEKFAGAFDGLEHILVLPWSERLTGEQVDYLARSLREAVERLKGGAS